MHLDKGGDAAIRVTTADDGQDGEQQDVRQLVDLTLRPAVIRHLLQQARPRRKRGHGNLHLSCHPMSQRFADPGILPSARRRRSAPTCGAKDSPPPPHSVEQPWGECRAPKAPYSSVKPSKSMRWVGATACAPTSSSVFTTPSTRTE